MSAIPTPSCCICDRALTPLEARGRGVCGDWRCREAVLRREAESERRRAAALIRRRRTDVPSHEDVEWVNAPIVIVPSRVSRLSPLPPARRGAFLAHLDELFRTAIEPLDGDETANDSASKDGAAVEPFGRAGDARNPGATLDSASVPAPASAASQAPLASPASAASPALREPVEPAESVDPLLGQICAACQGACCHAGGTHAFLDAPRIREILGESDDVATLRAEYVRLLPARTVRGSCVFHTDRGCNLPRERRGALCNRYECRGLESARELRGAAGGTAPGVEVVHVVRRADQVIRDSAFVGEGWLERVRGRNPTGGPRRD